jgi:hypothetical protein
LATFCVLAERLRFPQLVVLTVSLDDPATWVTRSSVAQVTRGVRSRIKEQVRFHNQLAPTWGAGA